MKNILSLMICMLIVNLPVYGKDLLVKIEVRPILKKQGYAQQSYRGPKDYRPIVGELFQVNFIVEFEGAETPSFPSFKPAGLEIVKRHRTRNKITIKNGVALRRTSFSYSMIAERIGTVSLNNIRVLFNGVETRVNRKSIKVLKSRPKPKIIFLESGSSRESVYPGEGVDISYYLYIRDHAFNQIEQEEKKTPSFKNVFKRVKPIAAQPKKIFDTVAGQPFGKYLVYSIRAFAQKPGKIGVGPLKTEVRYRRGYNRVRTKTISSARLDIPVKELPLPIPNTYSGLVGKHTFELSVPRKRFIVNDPIELSLIIEGEGSLESIEAPSLLNDPNIEKFDAQSEITIDHGERTGRIKYNFTYLARSPLTLPSRKITFSTLNPDSGEYEHHFVEMPEIVVGGKAADMQKNDVGNNHENIGTNAQGEIEKVVSNKELVSKMLAPDFSIKSNRPNRIMLINYILAAIALVIWLSVWFRRSRPHSIDPNIQRLVDSMKKSGITYSQIHHLLLYLNNNEVLVDITLGQLILNSQLTDGGKQYFSNIIAMTEKQNYGDVLNIDVEYNPKFFKELVELLKK